MSKKETRTIQLLEMLQIHKRLDVDTVSTALDISEATVRRLFAELEKKGKVIRTHGGVQIAPYASYDYSYRLSTLHRNKEKTVIGNAAAKLIENNDHIFLDSGTTVIKMAEALSLRIQTGELKNIVVLSNSFNLIDTLANWCKVILIGGEVRIERKDVCGSIAERNLSLFRVTKAFLGADAISIESGFMTTDERTAQMAELIVARSETTFVLADSEKFNRSSFISYAPLHAVRGIYTDDGLAGEVFDSFTKAGAQITIVQR